MIEFIKAKPKVLHLSLKKKWFDLIKSGEKKKEYREVTPYWIKRLLPPFYHRFIGREKDLIEMFKGAIHHNGFDVIEYRNGYGHNVPSFQIEFKSIQIEKPVRGWVEDKDLEKFLFAIDMGQFIEE